MRGSRNAAPVRRAIGKNPGHPLRNVYARLSKKKKRERKNELARKFALGIYVARDKCPRLRLERSGGVLARDADVVPPYDLSHRLRLYL